MSCTTPHKLPPFFKLQLLPADLAGDSKLPNSPLIPPSSPSASSQRGKAPQQSSAQPSWSRLSPQGLSQNESQSSTERCQSQALIPAWILLISLETSRERFTHPREGRSLAQGDWAAGLEQSPELSQGFSERQREGGKLWLFGEQKAVNSHSHCMLS